MSPAPANAPPLLMHLQAPADAGLAAVLRVCAPDARVTSQPFALREWLRGQHDPALEGVVLDADGLDRADLRLVLASLEREPRPWLLVLVGDRGVVGCEALLAAERTLVLPQPWTPAGLTAALKHLRAQPATRAAGASDAFLAGLVEGFRDPLTSLGGYLQLLEHQGLPSGNELVQPAVEAARALERQVECLYLASAPLRSRPERLDLRALAGEMLSAARREDARTESELAAGDLHVHADPRFTRAAMDVGRLLLSRFGPGGALRLRAAADADGAYFGWELAASAATPAAAPAAVAPPPYLSELCERLAARVPARAVIDRMHGAVPVRAALRWPSPRE